MSGSSGSMSVTAFIERFGEEPGYFDFATVGPIGRAVRDEEHALSSLIGRARFGTLASLEEQDARVREAVAAIIHLPAENVVFQPNASQAFMHGIAPLWAEPEQGRVTPGTIRVQLTDEVAAVAVRLVDPGTGFLVDLDGIRQVIGDRLLFVDATQGFGIVDADWEVADAIAARGQTWARAGWGTGFLALSKRALETPGMDAPRFAMSDPDPVAQARLAAALEELADVGVAAVAIALADRTSHVIDLADEFGITVASSRDESERAGIVVLAPPADQLTLLTASLHNHGVSVATRDGSVRLSPHVTTSEESFSMLRAALVSFGSAIRP